MARAGADEPLPLHEAMTGMSILEQRLTRLPFLLPSLKVDLLTCVIT